ncbi:MAG: hypothetical protein [Caudoviricetes sp.]|nr:MAG: hypothetical protein [Caudoviricetes sp.]
MVKKFKIIQNLERKYNGENLPIVVRQDDVGTIIESQILTEENNPYDLTNCNVEFSIQAASGWPVIGEKAQIIDPANGKISYSLTAKDTQISGKTKAAYFSIYHNESDIVESTGNIDLIILARPKIKDSDLLSYTTNFKNKIAGDRSNPNWAGSLSLSWVMIDPDNPDSGRYRFTITNTCTDEMTQKNYDDAFKTDKNDIQMRWYQDPHDISKYTNKLAYRFLIKPNTIKMRINNLFPHKVIIANKEIAPDNPLMYKDDGSLDIEGNDHYYATHGYMDNLIEIKADVALTGFTPLEETNLSVKQDNGTYKDISYVSSFELDFRKNRFLTKNNELIMIMPYYYVEPAEPGTKFFVTPHPNIECVQYCLPENTD